MADLLAAVALILAGAAGLLIGRATVWVHISIEQGNGSITRRWRVRGTIVKFVCVPNGDRTHLVVCGAVVEDVRITTPSGEEDARG